MCVLGLWVPVLPSPLPSPARAGLLTAPYLPQMLYPGQGIILTEALTCLFLHFNKLNFFRPVLDVQRNHKDNTKSSHKPLTISSLFNILPQAGTFVIEGTPY